jgi:hypothetical protein
MLFEEDLSAGPKKLQERLEFIRAHPPVRGGAGHKFVHNAGVFEQVKRALAISATAAPAPSDLKRLRCIEEEVSRETKALVPLKETTRLLYTGYPGTGKTFRLLQIGMFHALAGRRVLFACFNKVLAADIRRVLSHSQRLKESSGLLHVTDVFDLLRAHAHQRGIKVEEADYDEWGQVVT